MTRALLTFLAMISAPIFIAFGVDSVTDHYVKSIHISFIALNGQARTHLAQSLQADGLGIGGS